jgi:hypothetical protein
MQLNIDHTYSKSNPYVRLTKSIIEYTSSFLSDCVSILMSIMPEKTHCRLILMRNGTSNDVLKTHLLLFSSSLLRLYLYICIDMIDIAKEMPSEVVRFITHGCVHKHGDEQRFLSVLTLTCSHVNVHDRTKRRRKRDQKYS